MKITSIFLFLAISLLAGCQSKAISTSSSERFDISANTVPCEGPFFPMRCLIVNGEYFYDAIEGYQHIEGSSATIYVERRKRPDPIPADVGKYTYHVVSTN